VAFRVGWTPRALRDARKLDPPTRHRMLRSLERDAENEEGDVIRLAGIQPPEWRLRVGDWRVRFRLDTASGTLQVLRVLPRDKAYR
jgi:mRNA-degrading endonuclease RelE of RelBE toxin-antitoxin system